MSLNNLFKGKELFISVHEGARGIETYYNPMIGKLSKPIKAQIKAFIDEIIKEIGR